MDKCNNPADKRFPDKDANNWADYWRYFIGANVIPANTREKTVSVSWKEYQNNAISDEQHNKWKVGRAFDNGMAVIAGKIWHNSLRKDSL